MKQKLFLGYDIGSSSIKASLINAETGKLVSSASFPEREMKISSPQIGWAEQHPDMWWQYVVSATKKMFAKKTPKSYEILGIGISYQMHGLVMVDKDLEVLYPSIIWCDSRAVEIGNKALLDLGNDYCLSNCLNSPGNFTASKLKWVKDNLPDVYSKIYKIMLPGDYIALKLTGKVCSTVSGLSEGIMWDFKEAKIAGNLLDYYGFDKNILPDLVPAFGLQGNLTPAAARQLKLTPGIPVSYRAGDQPNNALSLNVLNPGEVAATAGTSGVIYGVAGKNIFDPESRVNTFAHVNYTKEHPNVGVLLCINGTGIQYNWLKQNIFENKYSYNQMNDFAAKVEIGSQGIQSFPFGNGAERVLKSIDFHASFSGINFNVHHKGHLIRAAQEGIVFGLGYGLDVMKSIGMEFNIVRAGNSNLFQSKVFKEAFVNTCNVNLEIYNTDGSQGAARGAGIGTGYYSEADAFKGLKVIERLSPREELVKKYGSVYKQWKNNLNNALKYLD
ncbi:MAG TPA: FGGY family carbohydrate kinase [Ignavibacteriaceae bacterium]|nr:FGGY family carbohydrate kinase [Ignavibacteriaceae bacterium]